MMHPYARRGYAQALAHVGEAVDVAEWGCCVLRRAIAGSGLWDAMGAYPIAAMAADADIAGGIARLKAAGCISATLVLGAFNGPPPEAWRPHAALLKPYKTHYIHRPAPGGPQYKDHHRRAVQKAQRVRTQVVPLAEILPQWCALYDGLIAQLRLTGLHAFPQAHHRALAAMEGVVAVGGFVEDALVSCHVWVEHGGRVHSHLVATNAAGYETRAAFAVNDASLRHFAAAEVVNFGGGAGHADDPDDGLARFKRGFANDTAQAYLCGIILDAARYRQLAAGKTTDYFPAYRRCV